MADTLPTLIARRIGADYLQGPDIQPGDQLPSVRALCEHYAVSSTTVVNALSILAAQGRVVKQHGRGCFIGSDAPERPPASVDMLGFVVPTAEGGGTMLRAYAGIARSCRAREWHVAMASADFSPAQEREHVARLVESGCRSIAILPVSRTPDELHHDYLKSEFRDVDIVLLDIAYPEQGRPQIVFDNYRAGYDMAAWLIGQGHTHIAFATADLPDGTAILHRSTNDRLAGYSDALAAAGITPRESDLWPMHLAVSSHGDEAGGLVRAWKAMRDRPTAVMALDDLAAVDLLRAAQEQGVDVPDDLRITGFDNLSVGRSKQTLFPTTEPDFARAGELAVELLDTARQTGRLDTFSYILPVPLVLPAADRAAKPAEHAV